MKRLILAIFICLFISTNAFAAAFTSSQTGDFNDGATWGNDSPGAEGTDFPGNADTATVAGTHVVTVNAVLPASGDLGVITINSGGTLAFSTSAATTSQLTMKGDISILAGGSLTMGTTGTPMPSDSSATIIFNNASNDQYELLVASTAELKMQGNSRDMMSTIYDSGVGTAGDPMITDDTTNWAVNDAIVVTTSGGTPADNEYKYIKTISGTSITLSDTAGGAESALSGTHASDTPITLMTHNVSIQGANGYDTRVWSKSNTFNDIDIDYAYFYYMQFNCDQYDCEFDVDYSSFDSGGQSILAIGQSYFRMSTTNTFSYINNYGTGAAHTYTNATYHHFIHVNGGHVFDAGQNYVTLHDNIAFGSSSMVSSGIGKGTILYNNQTSDCSGHFNFYQTGLHVNAYNEISGSPSANTEDFYDNNARSSLYVNMYNSDITMDGIANTNIGTGEAEYVNLWNYGQVEGRFLLVRNKGQISDQITAGEAAAWASGGSGLCAYLNPDSETDSLVWNIYIPATDSTAYSLKFNHKITSSFNGSLKITIYDSVDNFSELLTDEVVSFTDDSDWHAYTSTEVTPTANGFCKVRFEVLDGSTTGDIGIDDIELSTDIDVDFGTFDRYGISMHFTDGTAGAGGGSVTVGYGGLR